MNVSRPDLEAIISAMAEKLKIAKTVGNVHSIPAIERIATLAEHQLSLENGNEKEIIQGAQELLNAQAALLRYEEDFNERKEIFAKEIFYYVEQIADLTRVLLEKDQKNIKALNLKEFIDVRNELQKIHHHLDDLI